MHSELTDLKLQSAALQLEMMRLSGELAPDEEVTLAEYARIAGLSEGTVHKTFRSGLSRAAAAFLTDPDLPPHLKRRAAALIES